jgi:DinB superfamily
MDVGRPDASEFAPPFGKYIAGVSDGDILLILREQLGELHVLLDDVSDAESLAHHAPYTWSLRQVMGHLIDSERVFGYRAMRIARGDATPLASYDENAYMRAANFDRWPLGELVEEFDLLRRSHLQLFAHMEPDAWRRRGTAVDHPATTRAFAYVMAGHAKHHLDIVRRRLAGANA